MMICIFVLFYLELIFHSGSLLRLQFYRLMSGLPVPYPAVGRLMDAGIPAVINSTSRVVFKSGVFLLLEQLV